MFQGRAGGGFDEHFEINSGSQTIDGEVAANRFDGPSCHHSGLKFGWPFSVKHAPYVAGKTRGRASSLKYTTSRGFAETFDSR
jgi:hypothetical protein